MLVFGGQGKGEGSSWWSPDDLALTEAISFHKEGAKGWQVQVKLPELRVLRNHPHKHIPAFSVLK